jgi:hypothetical protein
MQRGKIGEYLKRKQRKYDAMKRYMSLKEEKLHS